MRLPGRYRLGLRLLPVLIVVAALALTVRMGDLWTEVADMTDNRSAHPIAGPDAVSDAGPDSFWDAVPAAGAADGAGAPADHVTSGPDATEVATYADGAGANLAESSFDPLSMTDEEIDLLRALAERRRKLEGRAQDIQYREAMLQAAERRIEEKVDGLKALRKSIEDLLQQHEEETESQYRSLVKIYENMRPKDAARIFDELDMAVLLPVVERMKERKIAPILAKMNAAKAKEVTTELAQRRQLSEAEE